tara:strand:+ start:1512 stop:1802 length:291 start_codon:yes stop_codon:yes gene_type:complete
MSWDYIDEKQFKILLKQIDGTITEKDGELVPYHVIKGEGEIWCYQPTTKSMIRLKRSTPIYVLAVGPEGDPTCLALSAEGNVFVIKKEEIVEIGFN